MRQAHTHTNIDWETNCVQGILCYTLPVSCRARWSGKAKAVCMCECMCVCVYVCICVCVCVYVCVLGEAWR